MPAATTGTHADIPPLRFFERDRLDNFLLFFFPFFPSALPLLLCRFGTGAAGSAGGVLLAAGATV